jgi:photosystem II stability/assembly factor-like uncharacterized protein
VGENGTIYTRPVSPPTTGILTFEPATLDYGFVALNSSQPLTLSLYNRGPTPLTITNITVTNASPAEIAFSASFPVTLGPGSNFTFNVFYNPSVNNSLSGQLVIRSSDPDGAQFVNLNGRSLLKGWVLKPSLTNSVGQTVVDLQMLSDTTGFALTPADIYKTTDGGNTWVELNLNAPGLLNRMSFVSTTVGWVCGGTSVLLNPGTGFILKTSNGGTSWTTQYSGTNAPVSRISMVNSSVGYAQTFSHQSGFTTFSGEFLQTVNGGTTWGSTNHPPAFPFSGIALEAVSASTIFSSSGTTLYRSTDFGATWTTNLTSGKFIRDVNFFGTQDGWMVGDQLTRTETVNGGNNWNLFIAPITTNSYNRVHFFTNSVGWIAPSANSAAAIYRSNDGGTNFFEELGDSPFSGPGNLKPTVVFGRPGTNAWALGTDGCVRRYETFTNKLQGIAVAPPVLDLGSSLVGSNVFRTFTLVNRGDATLTVSDLVIDGISRTNSSFRVTNTIPFALAVNASMQIGVVALNSDSGPTNATLAVISDGAAQTMNVVLRSTAVSPPQVVTFQTDPPGLALRIDGTNATAPVSFTVTQDANDPGEWLPDSTHSIEALDLQTINGQTFAFGSWDSGQDRLFTNDFAQASATYIASFVQDDPPPGPGGQGFSVVGPADPKPLTVNPPAGITNGPWLRLSQATVAVPILGNFTMSGAALLSANLMQLSLASTSVRMPTNTSQPAVAELTSGSWQFLRSNSLSRLSVASPGLKILNNSVTPAATLNLDFNLVGTNPVFAGNFSLPSGWKPAPGLLEFGSSSLTLGYTNFFSLSSTGQVRALKKPDGTWGFAQNLNLQFRDGPFTNTIVLPSSILQIFLPGTATEFLQVHGGASSFLKFRRDAAGVFAMDLQNLSLDMMGRTLTSLSGTASTAGLLTLSVAPPVSPFALGQFTWNPSGSSTFKWNIKNGALSFHLAGGTVASTAIAGFTDSLSFPDVDFDNQGDFNYTITLPVFTFNGIGLGLADDTNDRFVTFKRKNGVLSLSLRDKQPFFDGYTSLGFDFDSAGNTSGFFNGVFAADFGFPLGNINFGSVSASYNSALTPYQFVSQFNLAGNDFRIKFGSGGAAACHLVCGPTGCAETLCLSFP